MLLLGSSGSPRMFDRPFAGVLAALEERGGVAAHVGEFAPSSRPPAFLRELASLAQPLEIDALFPIDTHQAESLQAHSLPPRSRFERFQTLQPFNSDAFVGTIGFLDRFLFISCCITTAPLRPPSPASAQFDPRGPARTVPAHPVRPSVSPAHQDSRMRRQQSPRRSPR